MKVRAGAATGALALRMHAAGTGRHDQRDDDDGRPGTWNRFVSTAITHGSTGNLPGVSPGPRPPSGIDTVMFSVTGRWNGLNGFTFQARATDAGEPSRGRDRLTVTVLAPNDTAVAVIDGVLTIGNIQSR